MLNVLQFVTFALGSAALALAVKHMVFFVQSRHHLSKSMMGMLGEQVVSAAGTMVFASWSLIASLMGVPDAHVNNMPPYIAIVIRTIMFTAMVHSTVRLSASVQKVMSDHDLDKSG